MEEPTPPNPPTDANTVRAKALIKQLLIAQVASLSYALKTQDKIKIVNAFLSFAQQLFSLQLLIERELKRTIAIPKLAAQEFSKDQHIQQAFLQITPLSWQTISALKSAISEYNLAFNSHDGGRNTPVEGRTMGQCLVLAVGLVIDSHTEHLTATQRPSSQIIAKYTSLLLKKYPLGHDVLVPRQIAEIKAEQITTIFSPIRYSIGSYVWSIVGWGVFLPLTVGEGLLRLGDWWAANVTDQPKLAFLAKCLVFPFRLLCWPDRLMYEFPQFRWLIRILNIVAWVTIGVLMPPLLAKLGWVITLETLPGLFAALSEIGISAVQVLSGLSAFGYIGIYQLMRVLGEYLDDVRITQQQRKLIFEPLPEGFPTPEQDQENLLSPPPSAPSSMPPSTRLKPQDLKTRSLLQGQLTREPSPESTVKAVDGVWVDPPITEGMFINEEAKKNPQSPEEDESLVVRVGMFKDQHCKQESKKDEWMAKDDEGNVTLATDLSHRPVTD